MELTLATVAAGAAALVVAVAGFQVALALGLPLGEATLGGRATTRDGVLSGSFRILAVLQAAVLMVIAWLILARADVVDAGLLGNAVVYWVTWAIVGFLALNTLANLTAPHPVERWGIGSITLVLVILVAIVAIASPS